MGGSSSRPGPRSAPGSNCPRWNEVNVFVAVATPVLSTENTGVVQRDTQRKNWPKSPKHHHAQRPWRYRVDHAVWSARAGRRPAAKDRGSGHSAAGDMVPQRLWGKEQEPGQQAKLLQWLNARLSISSAEADQPGDLSIANSISLGPLKLRFNDQACKANAPCCIFALTGSPSNSAGGSCFNGHCPSPNQSERHFLP